jgi:alpha-tubulin suppressor-like RCC1 family protein
VLTTAADGDLFVWGSIEDGRLGLGFDVAADVFRPRKLEDLPAIDVSCGSSHTLVVDAARNLVSFGNVWCCVQALTVPGAERQARLRFGGVRGCAERRWSRGGVWHCGWDVTFPRRDGYRVHAVCLQRAEDGTVLAFGEGAIGDGETLEPTRVEGVPKAVDVAAGRCVSLAVTRRCPSRFWLTHAEDGEVWGWGRGLPPAVLPTDFAPPQRIDVGSTDGGMRVRVASVAEGCGVELKNMTRTGEQCLFVKLSAHSPSRRCWT